MILFNEKKGEIMVDIIQIKENNIDKENICCVITEKKEKTVLSLRKNGLKKDSKMDLFLKN